MQSSLRFILTGISLCIMLSMLTVQGALAQLPGPPTRFTMQQQGVWLGYFNQTRLSNRWGYWFDGHFRTTQFLDRWSLFMVRPGLTYYVRNNVRLTVGYSFIETQVLSSRVSRPEHRLWQQVWWSGKSGRLNLTQWIRTEQRFNRRLVGDQLAEGNAFNWRVRYNALLQIPLKGDSIKPHVPNFVLQNEVFVNFGKEVVFNTFDQNRFFVGISYPFNKQLTGQLGYMNQYIQQPSGFAYTSNNTVRLFFFHNLDWRKK